MSTRAELGKKALFHGLELARYQLAEGIEEAAQIAAACGVRRLPAGGRALRVIERVFGVRAALRYHGNRQARACPNSSDERDSPKIRNSLCKFWRHASLSPQEN